MKLTTLNVVSPVASISLLIGSDVHHFVFTVLYCTGILIVSLLMYTDMFTYGHTNLMNGFSSYCSSQTRSGTRLILIFDFDISLY